MSHRFPPVARVRTRADFDRSFRQGRRTATPLLVLHHVAAATPPRLGLAVSRKVDPRAVGRNRIKRILREAFRHLRGQLAAGDYVIVLRAAARGTDAATLRAAFERALRQAGALPRPDTDGTMPAVTNDHPPASSASDPADGTSLPA